MAMTRAICQREGVGACTRGSLLSTLALVACGRSGILVDDADGVCSADGEGFFAQVVLDYDPTAAGGELPSREDAMDPQTALGPPDAMSTPPLGAVSLGDGGTLTLGFGACVITTDGSPAADVIVHEHGYLEHVAIALLPTARAVASLGDVVGGDGWVAIDARPDRDDGIDLDTELGMLPRAGLRFEAIRLRDIPGQGEVTPETPGADIDAVELTAPLAEP
jgi:hypothetical protein